MSTLNVSNITDGTDTVETGYVVNGSAKAWARADGTATLLGSFNIASTVDNPDGTTGRIRFNFTNSMSDANYSAQGACNGSGADRFASINNMSASSLDANLYDGSARTELPVGISVHGDLA